MMEDIKDLLLWARSEKIQITKLHVTATAYGVELEVIDLHLAEVAPPTAGPLPAGEKLDEEPVTPADLYARIAQQHGLNADASDFQPPPRGKDGP